GAIGEACVYHRRRFIHSPSDARHDAVDDLHQVCVVFERKSGEFQLAGALDVDPVKAVYEDVGDARVLQQRFQRAESKNLVENLAGQPFAFRKTEGNCLGADGAPDQNENFIAGGRAVGAAQFLEVETVEDLPVKIGFYLLVLATLEGLQISHEFSIPS